MRAWLHRFVHNVIAHPLLVLCPPLGEWLHDRTEPDAAARVATTFEDGTTVSVRREPPQSASVPTISDAARLVAEGEPNLALAALDQRREAADAARQSPPGVSQ